MRYRFVTCDVFTDRRFCGNPLAVLPNAQGLERAQMQQIAREFNYSETTFVEAPERGGTRKVRIFTPTAEVPFAGHPNVGTAFVLASSGELGDLADSSRIVFEEAAGDVPVTIHSERGRPLRCELSAPQPLALGKELPIAEIAAALSLTPAEILSDPHPPRSASVGLPFTFVELRDRAALTRAHVSPIALERLRAHGTPLDLAVFVRSSDEFDLRMRVLIPMDGLVVEDPATGSAACALGAMLAQLSPELDASFQWRIAQGVEMGRPSLLEASVDKCEGRILSVRVAGACVPVSEGFIEVD